MTILYHFTAERFASKIAAMRSPMLLPLWDWSAHELYSPLVGARSPGIPFAPPVVWLTDQREPDPNTLGLERIELEYDRMEFRLTVLTDRAVRWFDWCKRHRPDRKWRAELEDGRAPETWFVSELALPVRSMVNLRCGKTLEEPKP